MLTLYQEAASFLEAAQHRLMKQEALNSQILGIALRLKDNPNSYLEGAPFFATWAESGTVTYAALMTPPYGMLVATLGSALDEPVNAVIESLISGGWPVPSVNAPAPSSAHFARLWARRTGSSAYVDMRERLFQLNKVIPPIALPSGSMRKAGESDIPTLASWIAAFRAESMPNDPPLDGLRTATQRLNTFYLWDDGGPVAMMANNRSTVHLASVGLVYTPPELRGRGYATALVAAGSQALLDAGHTACVLFTDLANPISNSIYQKIGYRPIADFEIYRFQAV